MQFLLADPSLKKEVGYHASLVRYLKPMLRAFGAEPIVLSHKNSSPALVKDLSTVPFFRCGSENLYCVDPDLGVRQSLDVFQALSEATLQDFDQLPLTPNDCIYLSATDFPQLMAVTRFLKKQPPSKRPKVILHLAPNLIGTSEPVATRWMKTFASQVNTYLSRDLTPYLKLVSFEKKDSQHFSTMLNFPVDCWPQPQHVITRRSDRTGKAAVTIAILGCQTLGEGSSNILPLANAVLGLNRNLALLVHNDLAGGGTAEQEALRKMASVNNRIILSESAVDDDAWIKFLNAADIILFPGREPLARSGIVNEAIANGIPIIVPQNTLLSQRLVEFGSPGCSFTPGNVSAMTEAVTDVVDRYKHFAQTAASAKTLWSQNHGGERTVIKILEWYPIPTQPLAMAPKKPARVISPSENKRPGLRSERILMSWYCDPSYIPPPVLSSRQVTVGPHPIATARTYHAPNRRNRFDAYTPFRQVYDLQKVVETQGISGPFDVVVVFAESTLNNIPINVRAFNCPTVLYLGDTHHGNLAIANMIRYARMIGFDRIVTTYNRQHLHWFSEAGFERTAWIPAISAKHIPQPKHLLTKSKNRMAFVGQLDKNLHTHRWRLHSALEAAGINVKARIASREEAASLYNTSTLSFNASLNGDLNLRMFEVLSAGGCLLTDRLCPESGQSVLFEEGHEFLAYSSSEELIEKVNRYLADPLQALKVAEEGHRKYVSRYLPEYQASALMDWVLSDKVLPEYRSGWDIRPKIARMDPAPLADRIAIYEQVQETHRVNETVRVLLSPNTPVCIAADMIDLPRVECSILSAPGVAALLKEYGLADRVSYIDTLERARTTPQWDYLITVEGDIPALGNIAHNKRIQVARDPDRTTSRTN